MSTWGTWGGGGWGDDQDEDEDNEFDPSRQYSTSKDSLILLIESTQGMFSKNADGEIPFELCIKCVKSVLLNKIVSNDKDSVAVVFFGTDKHKNPNDFKHVYILQELDTPDAPRIKEIEEMLNSDDFDDFETKYGHSDAFSMSDVLWTCSSMLSTGAAKNSHKRILLFTNNDNPHATSPSLQRQAKTKAKDLLDNGVEIDLMHIGSSFDVPAFYQDIISTGDDDVTALPNPSEKFDELLTRVRSKEFKKRAMQRISLSLGPGLDLGVGVYCLVREAKKPSFVRLDQRTNEELKTQTKMLCDDTGAELMPTDIKYYQEFGGEKVIFEKEEVTEMKKLCDRGLTLMGFKPCAKLKRHMYIKPSSFVYPDESEITGSTRLFSTLLDRCLARDVVAICRYTPTSNAPPRFVALVPQKEELDENSVQVSAPGFHVVFLPFAEELRNVDYGEHPKASVEQIDKAKEIIKKLTFNFQSDAFENPALQKHYRHLEAIALEYESVEDISDLTEPDEDRITKRAGNLLDQFKELVYPADYDPEKKRTAKRKPAATSAGGGTSKRAKTDSGPLDVESLAKSGKLSSLKVSDLKEYLKSVGKKAAGKKQELIDAVNEHLLN